MMTIYALIDPRTQAFGCTFRLLEREISGEAEREGRQQWRIAWQPEVPGNVNHVRFASGEVTKVVKAMEAYGAKVEPAKGQVWRLGECGCEGTLRDRLVSGVWPLEKLRGGTFCSRGIIHFALDIVSTGAELLSSPAAPGAPVTNPPPRAGQTWKHIPSELEYVLGKIDDGGYWSVANKSGQYLDPGDLADPAEFCLVSEAPGHLAFGEAMEKGTWSVGVDLAAGSDQTVGYAEPTLLPPPRREVSGNGRDWVAYETMMDPDPWEAYAWRRRVVDSGRVVESVEPDTERCAAMLREKNVTEDQKHARIMRERDDSERPKVPSSPRPPPSCIPTLFGGIWNTRGN